MSKIMATLVRGSTYNLVAARLSFKGGEPLEVTKEQKAHLEKHAIDTVTVSDRGTQINEDRQKFVFEEVMDTKEPLADVAPGASDSGGKQGRSRAR
jgi:hypothetical protein